MYMQNGFPGETIIRRRTSCIPDTSTFDNIGLNLNCHERSALETDQYFHLCICLNRDLMHNLTNVVCVVYSVLSCSFGDA